MGTGRCFYSPSIAIALVGGARRASVVVARAECPEGAGTGLEYEWVRAAGPAEASCISDVDDGIAGPPSLGRYSGKSLATSAQRFPLECWASSAWFLSGRVISPGLRPGPRPVMVYPPWARRTRQHSIELRAHTEEMSAEVSACLGSLHGLPLVYGPALSSVIRRMVTLANCHRQGCRSVRHGVTLRCLASSPYKFPNALY
jgi:hypothetical protein